jgi:hypothetical protein
MKLPELDELIRGLIVADDHPGVVRVELLAVAGGDNPKTYHPRVKVHYADGGASIVQVYNVSGPKIPNAGKYTVPQEAL